MQSPRVHFELGAVRIDFMDSRDHHRFCLIIGAGPSELIQAAELIRQGVLTLEHLTILQRNVRFGVV